MIWTLLLFLLNPLPLQVSHRARSLQPGEVVVIKTTSSVPLKTLAAKVFDLEFAFYPAEGENVWDGLIGIDLETRPGTYTIELEGLTDSGEAVYGRYDLAIEAKEFPTRRLTVAEKYVNPRKEVMSRIRREAKRIDEIFSTSTAEKVWSGSFTPPVPGAPASSSFGKRSILNNQPRSPHSGTDFNAEQGTPVKAPNKGRVVLVSDLYYSGNTVILDHGHGLYSYFAHLSKFAVAEGDIVSAGDVLGYVGATGRVTGPHLHWSVRLKKTRVDPLSLMEILAEPDLEVSCGLFSCQLSAIS